MIEPISIIPQAVNQFNTLGGWEKIRELILWVTEIFSINPILSRAKLLSESNDSGSQLSWTKASKNSSNSFFPPSKRGSSVINDSLLASLNNNNLNNNLNQTTVFDNNIMNNSSNSKPNLINDDSINLLNLAQSYYQNSNFQSTDNITNNNNEIKNAPDKMFGNDWRKSTMPSNILRATKYTSIKINQHNTNITPSEPKTTVRTGELENVFGILFEMCDYFDSQSEAHNVEIDVISNFHRSVVCTVLSIFNDHISPSFNITRVRTKLKFFSWIVSANS